MAPSASAAYISDGIVCSTREIIPTYQEPGIHQGASFGRREEKRMTMTTFEAKEKPWRRLVAVMAHFPWS